MAKQHSDNMEDRFREAAENISFPPNEEAWNKMEALLDKDKRRRPVFVWWLLVLFVVLAGAGIAYKYFGDSPQTLQVEDGSILQNTGKADRSGKNNTALPEAGPESPNANRQSAVSGEPDNTVTMQQRQDINAMERNKAVEVIRPGKPAASEAGGRNINRSIDENLNHSATGARSDRSAATWQNRKRSGINVITGKRDATSGSISRNKKSDRGLPADRVVQSGARKNSLKTREKNNSNSASVAELEQGNDEADNAGKKAYTDSVKTSTGSDLSLKNAPSISTSAAQDIDSASDKTKLSRSDSVSKQPAPVRISAPSKKWLLDKGFNISLGARIDATDLHKISLHQFNQLAAGSIGYRFSNRFSVQAGIVVQKAVYYAGPQDYYVKPGSYLSMYRISKIDAICQIYEIPVSVRYDVLMGKGLRVYAVGGLSSFYLKKENYRYHATGSSGYRMFDSTYRANKNYFSSAYFAAGIEKKITPVFSVLAEPYAKLPVSGVGAGKVRLYSGGIQFMLRYQPQSAKRSSPQK